MRRNLDLDPPLRILLVSSSSGSQGGGELYLTALSAQLGIAGHQVEVMLSDHARMDQLADGMKSFARVHRVPYVNTYDRRWRVAGALCDRRGIARLTSFFRRVAPDVIHVNKQNVEDGLDLLLAANRSGLPHLTTIHITRSMAALRAHAGKLRDRISRKVLRSVNGNYLAIAKSCQSELRAYLLPSAQSSSIHVVCNGVSPAPQPDRAAIRRQWNCGDNDVVLGCVARIEAQKNPLFLVELLARLPNHVKLVWVGDGRLRGELESTAARTGVAHRLLVEGWRADARSRMAGFDVFVLPSLYEGFPFAVLEALAAGLPCVVSDADGTREAVIDGECGRVLPPSDRDAWLKVLSEVVTDEQVRMRLGTAALERYRRYFSLESMTQGTIAVYRQVVAEAKSA